MTNRNFPEEIAGAITKLARARAGRGASDEEVLGAQLAVLVNDVEPHIETVEREIVDELLRSRGWTLADVARVSGLGYKTAWGRWGREAAEPSTPQKRADADLEGLTPDDAWKQTGVYASAIRKRMNAEPEERWHRDGRVVDVKEMRIAINGGDGSTPTQVQHITGIDRDLVKECIAQNPGAGWHTKATAKGGVRSKTLVTDLGGLDRALAKLKRQS